jgi:hypothetical protein
MSLFKTRNVSETGSYLLLEVDHTQLDQLDRVSPCPHLQMEPNQLDPFD